MSTSAVIYFDDCINNDIIFNDKSVPSHIADELISKQIVDKIIFSTSENCLFSTKDDFNIHRRKESDIPDWKSILKNFPSDNYIKIYADTPFTDFSIISEMLEIHTKYAAEFTYSENLPEGLSPIIISSELIKTLPEQDGEKLDPLETLVKKNINQFDVELYYKGPDIRDKRISFRLKDPREEIIMNNIFSLQNKIPSYEEIHDIINQNPQVLYIAPSYYEIEITHDSKTDTICSIKNKKTILPEMDISTFENIISGADESGLPYTISLAGCGDPFCHSQFYKILNIALSSNILEQLIIETFAVQADENFISYLQDKNDSRIHVIAKVNGYDKETYSKIHTVDTFEKVYANIEKLNKYFGENSDQFYLEILKINETEEFLDKYYDHFENLKINIILQKQNIFLGKSEDRRYYDLSPVDRIPCWHLQRDFFILPNGSVAFCKQDINAEVSSGNINEKSVKRIFESKKDTFLKDYRKEFCKSPDCSSCDEWYTFNF